jgi:predicted RNA-binding Zn-ribbon protein involved in translation (DUF1610 family)
MPFIIWGSRGITSTKDRGEFYCPRCNRDRIEYALKSTRPWFTLYFIPLFPVGGSERYVECQRCGGTFREEVLDYEPPTESEQFLGGLFEELEGGASVESVRRKLEKLGMAPDKVEGLVEELTRRKVWMCPVCGNHYLEGVKKCRKCTDSDS